MRFLKRVATIVVAVASAAMLFTGPITTPHVESKAIHFAVPSAMPTYAEYEMTGMDAEMTAGPVVLDAAELTARSVAAVRWDRNRDWVEEILEASATSSYRKGDRRELRRGVSRTTTSEGVFENDESPSAPPVPIPPFALSFHEKLRQQLEAGTAEESEERVPCANDVCGIIELTRTIPDAEAGHGPLRSLPWQEEGNTETERLLYDLETMVIREHSVSLNGETTFIFRLLCFSLDAGATSCS